VFLQVPASAASPSIHYRYNPARTYLTAATTFTTGYDNDSDDDANLTRQHMSPTAAAHTRLFSWSVSVN